MTNTNEPIHILSLGAGVQSSAMALMAALGEITPMPKAAIFADTQDEPQAVYDWLSWLESQLPYEVIKVSKGSLSQHLTTVYKSKKNKKMTSAGLPAFVKYADGTQGLMSRQCTTDYKIDPVSKAMTKVMREHGAKKAWKWIGITTDEAHRIKDGKRKSTPHRHPLIELRMHRQDCLSWMKRHGYPEPPRSACYYCPYKSNHEWRMLPQHEFRKAVEFERKLQACHAQGSLTGKPYLHRSMVPLDRVDLSTDLERGQGSLWGNECEGMCGL